MEQENEDVKYERLKGWRVFFCPQCNARRRFWIEYCSEPFNIRYVCQKCGYVKWLIKGSKTITRTYKW